MHKRAVILAFILCAAFAASSLGQDQPQQPAAGEPAVSPGGVEPEKQEAGFDDWMKYKATFGEVKVVGVSEKTITIVDEGMEPPENVAVYYLAPELEVEGVKSADEIKVGDSVDIEYYVTDDGKNMADYIMVEKKEEEAPLEETGLLSPEEEEE